MPSSILLHAITDAPINTVRILAMYSVGAVAVAFSAIRIKAINNQGLAFKAYLESQFPFALWSVIEAFAPALCVNIPAIFGGATKLRSMRKSGRLPAKDKRYLLDSQSKFSAMEMGSQPGTSSTRQFQSFSSEAGKDDSYSMTHSLDFRAEREGNWL